ncbi:MAG TPA: bifunctional (p)ppGpp synthetase/guanosine-3',5'-bis(diphosphate) 3'-pyrophosphohydrolase [Roseateles sp.]|nr:bifunctional (p)ppGpp synthetase/guanosine-3',5'-bis(diphosphate) 3'-pyrophosphohydrolase [Roseateles sp.]HWT53857.1 bifunctional (p)ppGpp synthetase/guanosine-3',5'-bis(diphosphate) 3'-pyrophosphohydrolase [Rhodocyclaceae bacterium]
MVAVTQDTSEDTLVTLTMGLDPAGSAAVMQALALARELYAGRTLPTGEDMLSHAIGMAVIVAGLEVDADTRIAALLFATGDILKEPKEALGEKFGHAVADLVLGLHRLKGLKLGARHGQASPAEIREQTEVLRKMLLAMADDVRVVLMRLASRTQSLRYLTEFKGAELPDREALAREALELYAPLANRLGVWQLKWELEDLSFRFLEPATYKRIAKMLDERRLERASFIDNVVGLLKRKLTEQGVKAEVYGRPKHIYSIWNKMRGKGLEFSEVYDVRAVRIIVDEIKDCYTALGLVHQLWQPIPKEFDDYISHPKGNFYRSLHTAVLAEDGRALEVQIRTHEMHEHAELGVAAHWRYKESGSSAKAEGEYEDKIAWLRQLLSWRDEITDSAEWVSQFKRAALDDTIYVMTPQGRVIDLARGATPVDFAYRLHTDLGHRCRGARVDGQLVPLNTPLKNGQSVEIISAKSGGPSRDWLVPAQGYLATSRAKQKARQWFAALEEEELLTQGRAIVAKELQREGQTQANLEELAQKLGLKGSHELYLGAARGEIGPNALRHALHGTEPEPELPPEIQTKRSKAGGGDVLIVGVDKLLTQLGRCCKPVPPDSIAGFVTRGRGVSIHRTDCPNFRNMILRNPERRIEAAWGDGRAEGMYAVDLHVEATDRQGLLRDISEVLSREKVNVTAVKTLSKQGGANMSFTVELPGLDKLKRILTLLGEVSGVISVRRG